MVTKYMTSKAAGSSCQAFKVDKVFTSSRMFLSTARVLVHLKLGTGESLVETSASLVETRSFYFNSNSFLLLLVRHLLLLAWHLLLLVNRIK